MSRTVTPHPPLVSQYRRVTAATAAYLFTHADVNAFLTSGSRGVLGVNPQVGEDLQAIRATSLGW